MITSTPVRRIVAAIAVLACFAASATAAEPGTEAKNLRYRVLHEFNTWSGGFFPNGNLIRGSDGNFYGTTEEGPWYPDDKKATLGTVFRMEPDGRFRTIHRFGPVHLGGGKGGLTESAEGVLLGFRAEADGWHFYRIDADGLYTSTRIDDTVGTSPGPLRLAPDGFYYGVRNGGGPNGAGTVVRTTVDGTATLLHAFGGSERDLKNPTGRLLLASDGRFYGVAQAGGAHDCGGVFRIAPDGTEAVVHSFKHHTGCGSTELVQASDGSLYGSTDTGSDGQQRIIYKISPSGEFIELQRFKRKSNGVMIEITGAMVEGHDGNLYGFTWLGGKGGNGSLFRLTPDGVMTDLHSFGPKTGGGGDPVGAPVIDDEGRLYGVSVSGGAVDKGTAFAFEDPSLIAAAAQRKAAGR